MIQGASVNRAILQHCIFWSGNIGADAAVAILLPTLKHLSCNEAVDWSTTCFCCDSVLQKQWQFCDRSAWILKRVQDSSQSRCSISPCHQDLGSKLWGYWFYTTFDLCVKSVERWLQRARVTQNGVDFFQWPLSIPQYSWVYILFLHYHLSSLV
jgi:hypothetical protein